jgi:hypothetical protein
MGEAMAGKRDTSKSRVRRKNSYSVGKGRDRM